MTKRKKMIIGVLIVSVTAVAALGAIVTCGPNGAWGTGFHPGFHRTGFHPGPHGEDVADFILWKMDRHVKELGLNETQNQEYEKTKGEIKTCVAEAMERHREFHHVLSDEMSKENPDLNALANLVKDHLNQIPDVLSKHIDLFVEFYNTLDRDQKAQVIEMFRSRMDLPS